MRARPEGGPGEGPGGDVTPLPLRTRPPRRRLPPAAPPSPPSTPPLRTRPPLTAHGPLPHPLLPPPLSLRTRPPPKPLPHPGHCCQQPQAPRTPLPCDHFSNFRVMARRAPGGWVRQGSPAVLQPVTAGFWRVEPPSRVIGGGAPTARGSLSGAPGPGRGEKCISVLETYHHVWSPVTSQSQGLYLLLARGVVGLGSHGDLEKSYYSEINIKNKAPRLNFLRMS